MGSIQPPQETDLNSTEIQPADLEVDIEQDLTVNEGEKDFSNHSHHWRIEEPNGTTSMGQCKDCGSEKIFKNFLWGSGDMITNEELRLGAGDLSGLNL